jgi:hypothetical protein
MDQAGIAITLMGVLAILPLGCQNNSSTEQGYGTSTFVPVRDLTDNETFQEVLLDHGIHLFYSKVIAHQGQLIIASRGGKLLLVSMDGEVNWSLERPGSGPGEFDDPHDMQIDGNMIGIFNRERARVSLYTTGGEFYKDVPLGATPYQFGMVNGEIHTFHPYDTDYLFIAYDIETGEVRRYAEKGLIEVLPDQVTSENFMHFSNLLRTDERYTIVGLVYYAQILIYDRQEERGVLMDLSEEKEIVASLEWHREGLKDFPDSVTYHFLDIVKIGDYFGVMVPGPTEVESAIMYRISPDGRIHDKVYRPSRDLRVGHMKNLTLLSDGTYFGHITSQDRLVIVSIEEKELPD